MHHETDRLLLRPPRLSDADDLFGILGDIPSRPYTFNVATLRECRRYITANECQRRKLGYGLWIVVAKDSRRSVGFGGLYDDPFDGGWGPEIAYHLAPEAWGKGYATELTEYSLTLARDQFGIVEVKAFAHPDNAASRKVLSKAGFVLERFIPEMERHLYIHRLHT